MRSPKLGTSSAPRVVPDRSSSAAVAALLAGGLLWLSCARAPEPASEPPPLDDVEPAQLVETSIRVENRHWSDVTIYLFRRSARARLGTVTSNSTLTFRVPIGMGDGEAVDVSFLADAIGSDEQYRSERLTVLEGQEVLLRLEVRMVHSSTSVFWP